MSSAPWRAVTDDLAFRFAVVMHYVLWWLIDVGAEKGRAMLGEALGELWMRMEKGRTGARWSWWKARV